MNIQISNSNNESAKGQTEAKELTGRRKTNRIRTIALQHLQAQDLVGLHTASSAPAAFFQKRDR